MNPSDCRNDKSHRHHTDPRLALQQGRLTRLRIMALLICCVLALLVLFDLTAMNLPYDGGI